MRLGIGAIFIWASWDKLADPAGFARIVSNYRILPEALVNPAAILLPWVEALCGLMLIVGRLVRGSLVVVTLLTMVFALALAFNAYRGIDVACGCFSVAVKSGAGHYADYLLRDLVLLTAAVWCLWQSLKPAASEPADPSQHASRTS
jgi:uncharacterized membrane protein YphA (DoxX/SURF4 family)